MGTSLANRRLSTSDLVVKMKQEQGIDLGERTVRKRLREAGLRGCVAAKKPLLFAVNCKRRLSFACAHKIWTVDDWKTVLFSDESSFELFCSEKRVYVKSSVGERYARQCCVPTVKHGGGSLMVWGCMSGLGVGQLYRCVGSINQDQYIGILQNAMLPSATALFGQGMPFSFQQDKCALSQGQTGY